MMDIEEIIKKWDEQIALHRRVCDDPLMYTKEEKLKNSHYAQAICAVVADLKKLAIPTVSKSFTAEEVVNELEDCDTLDDAIMFFKEQM